MRYIINEPGPNLLSLSPKLSNIVHFPKPLRVFNGTAICLTGRPVSLETYSCNLVKALPDWWLERRTVIWINSDLFRIDNHCRVWVWSTQYYIHVKDKHVKSFSKRGGGGG